MQPRTRKALKRIGVALIWTAVLTGFVILLAAAVQDKESGRCKGLVVKMEGSDNNYFIEEKDIRALIINPVGTPIKNINLAEVEKMASRDPWVKKAECYIDNQRMLNIKVTQREPIARVFTNAGSSFYFDKDGDRIPVSSRYAARVPVFTGFPAEAPRLDSADSTLAAGIMNMGNYITSDPFWSAEVEQVNITPEREFEITPKLGDHVIEFGDGEEVEKKFSKLLAFYKEGLNKVGWNNYAKINVAYENEVVCTRRSGEELSRLLATADSARRAAGDTLARLMIHGGDEKAITGKVEIPPAEKPKVVLKNPATVKKEPKAVYKPVKKKSDNTTKKHRTP